MYIARSIARAAEQLAVRAVVGDRPQRVGVPEQLLDDLLVLLPAFLENRRFLTIVQHP